jgi:hypothetical protein
MEELPAFRPNIFMRNDLSRLSTFVCAGVAKKR